MRLTVYRRRVRTQHGARIVLQDTHLGRRGGEARHPDPRRRLESEKLVPGGQAAQTGILGDLDGSEGAWPGNARAWALEDFVSGLAGVLDEVGFSLLGRPAAAHQCGDEVDSAVDEGVEVDKGLAKRPVRRDPGDRDEADDESKLDRRRAGLAAQEAKNFLCDPIHD